MPLAFLQRQPNATKRAQTNGAIPRASLNFNLKLVHILRMIYINCHSAGNYLKVSTAVLNQALPFCACNYFRAFFFSTMHQKKRFLLKDKNTSAHILPIIYTNCHSAGKLFKSKRCSYKSSTAILCLQLFSRFVF